MNVVFVFDGTGISLTVLALLIAVQQLRVSNQQLQATRQVVHYAKKRDQAAAE